MSPKHSHSVSHCCLPRAFVTVHRLPFKINIDWSIPFRCWKLILLSLAHTLSLAPNTKSTWEKNEWLLGCSLVCAYHDECNIIGLLMRLYIWRGTYGFPLFMPHIDWYNSQRNYKVRWRTELLSVPTLRVFTSSSSIPLVCHEAIYALVNSEI